MDEIASGLCPVAAFDIFDVELPRSSTVDLVYTAPETNLKFVCVCMCTPTYTPLTKSQRREEAKEGR